MDNDNGIFPKHLKKYAFQQRGTNENINGLFRQFFLNSSFFDDFSDQQIKTVANLI